MMTMLRADQIQPRLLACALAIFLCLAGVGCQKESEAIVSIALHPTNANILYVATNDAVYKSRDEGQLWERFPSFSARRVTTLAIDPDVSIATVQPAGNCAHQAVNLSRGRARAVSSRPCKTPGTRMDASSAG